MALPYLPEEIQVHIFLKLPVSCILCCRKVCKVWRSLLCSGNFIKTHTDHGIRNPKLMLESHGFKEYTGSIFLSIDYLIGDMLSSTTCDGAVPMDYLIRDMLSKSTDVRMLGSCNGLICMALNMFKDICIWNPSTGEYKAMQLPFCDSLMESFFACRYGYGLCYDCIAGNYKLVRIVDEKGFAHVNVYTIGSKSWKTIQNTNHYMFYVRNNYDFFLNGSLHWIGFNTKKEVNARVIVSFDVSRESFVDFLLPKEAPCYSLGILENVGVLEDCLSFVSFSMFTNHVDVWLMQDYGVRESWTKRFSLSTKKIVISDLKLLRLFTNGELLIDTGYGKLLHDPKNDSFEDLKIQGTNDTDVRNSMPQNYVESLVSLNSIGEGIISRHDTHHSHSQEATPVDDLVFNPLGLPSRKNV